MPRYACLCLLICATLSGCASVGYGLQAVGGHLDVMARREPVTRVLARPDTRPALRESLARAQDMRHFAARELGLPDNDSFRSYADLDRPYVVWNVVATPALSLKPRSWCFFFVGCIEYRGYFRETSARAYAAKLAATGMDVTVGGVAAYSTLGWFADPLLDNQIDWPAYRLAGLIFHELAHQQVYVRNDSAFNESFASAVELAGMGRWLATQKDPALIAAYQVEQQRQRDFLALVSATRKRLKVTYAGTGDEKSKLAAKAAAFAAMRADYQKLRARWGGYAGYDRWFGDGLNNARLAAVHTYQQWVPAFMQILREADGDFPRFYAAVEKLSRLPRKERDAALRAAVDRARKSGSEHIFG